MAVRKGLGKGLDSLIPGNLGSESDFKEDLSEKSTNSSTISAKNVDKTPESILKEAEYIDIINIERNKDQPRAEFDEEALKELADSIRQYGILQPLLVRKDGTHYVIIAGERRWRAAKMAGIQKIPVIIKEYSDQEVMEVSLIENLQRENLNAIEEAAAYRRLMEEFGYRQEDLAQKISKSRTMVANRMRLLKLPEDVQEMVKNGEISEGHARAILALESEEQQCAAAKKIAEEHLNVREAEKLVKKWMKPQKEIQEDWKADDQFAYDKMEEDLKHILGTKAEIKRQGKHKGKIVIDYYSLEDLERILDKLRAEGR